MVMDNFTSMMEAIIVDNFVVIKFMGKVYIIGKE